MRFCSPNPKLRNGQFGNGWHLLLPIRIAFGKPDTPVGQVLLPSKISVVGQLHGRDEVLHFRDDHPSGVIGYFPLPGAETLTIGVALMNDGSLRLEDKLGCVFDFNGDGQLVEMILSEVHHVSFKYEPLTSFERKPYRIVNVRGSGEVTIADGAVAVPKQLQLEDAFNQSIVFKYDDKSEDVAWSAAKKESGANERIVMMADGSLRLHDQYGATVAFDPAGSFQAILPSLESDIVSAMVRGDQRVEFRYRIASDGRLIVDEAWAFTDPTSRSPDYVIGYEYSQGSQLAGRDIQMGDGKQLRWVDN